MCCGPCSLCSGVHQAKPRHLSIIIMASLRHRRGIGAAKGYDDYIHDNGSGTAPDTDTATDPEEEEEEEDDDEEEEEEEEEEEDGRRLHLGLQSMTAKVSSVPTPG